MTTTDPKLIEPVAEIIEAAPAAWGCEVIAAIRRWFWRGHNIDGQPCPACPFPHLPHDHARNEQTRSGFY